MNKEVTNEELARMIAEGFAGTATKQDLTVVKDDLAVVKTDVAEIKNRLEAVENKLDRALYKELDVHERWIKQLANKAGIELSR
ncbi:MAG: hypothetical protein WC621_05175 [Patescibacteria group bacterium]